MSPRKKFFPYEFSKNGRQGKIYKLGNGTFKTHFIFAHKTYQNTFSTFENAKEHLNAEFDKLDTQPSDAQSQFPLKRDRRFYWELEQRLQQEAEGASLHLAVDFFLTFHKKKSFKPLPVSECVDKLLASATANGTSNLQIRTLKRHYNHFKATFGSRKIHTIEAQEIAKWLENATFKGTGTKWSTKTKKNTRGSLVSLGTFATNVLKALPQSGEPTEFEKVPTPKVRFTTEVDIYTPEEMQKLLRAAVEHDIEFLPILILCGLLGLRPSEAHGEDVDRPKLTWDAVDWDRKELHVLNQKVRSKRPRTVPIQKEVFQWLLPFKGLKGPIWKWKTAHDGRFSVLRGHAGVRAIQDGLRHSYCSYRVKQLGDLVPVSVEMGNSPEEITRSYKRGVKDDQAKAWFSIKPPSGYNRLIRSKLPLSSQ
jgi:integrase